MPPQPCYLSWQKYHRRWGVGDVIEKSIDRRYIGIFSSFEQITVIGKMYLEISKNYWYQKMCIHFHPINSIESAVLKTRKRVFHIPDEYEIVPENSAQSWAAILVQHSILIAILPQNLIFWGIYQTKLSKVDISALKLERWLIGWDHTPLTYHII